MNMADLKGFSEGKHEFRPAPFWSWNDKLDAEELLSQMKKMQKAGYGGFFMHSRVGLITPYLSDEWMDCIRLCAKKSGEYGLTPIYTTRICGRAATRAVSCPP